MKYIVYLIVLFSFSLQGCIQPAKQQEKIELVKRIDVEWSEENSSSFGSSFVVLTVDSCEYLYGYGSAGRFAHKGNCKYCIERNKSK